MGLFTLTELFTNATVEAIKGTIYGYLTANKLPVTAWLPLSPTRSVVDACSRLQQVAQNVIVTLAESVFVDTAAGTWLKNRALEQFEVTAIEITFATGEFVAVNSGGGSYDFDPGELTVGKVGSTRTYHNTEAVHIGIGETVAFPILADVAGSDSSAAAGELFLSTSVAGVAGTNQIPAVGQDEEETEAIRDRCRLSRGALSPNGPRAAYEYVARTPELNGGVVVNRVRRLPHTGDGLITVVIASTLGPIDPSDVSKVQIGIDTWATPATVIATVVSAGESPQTVAARVYIPLYGAPNTDDLMAAIKQSLIDYINALPIGGVQLTPGNGVVPWSGLVSAIKNTNLGGVKSILAVDLIGVGEVDVSVGPTEIATLLAASITLEFASVNP